MFNSEVNPYSQKVYDHPGRIFLFEDKDNEVSSIRELCSNTPTYCEIGSGSGTHLIELGKRNPKAKYFGFEIRYKRSVRTIEKAKEAKVDNVYVLKTHGEILETIFPENSLSGVYVNFPDPWAKKKQQKNRIIQTPYLNKLNKLLKDNGFFSFKTDHQEYFNFVHSLILKHPNFELSEHSQDLHNSSYLEQNIQTEFETLFLSQKLPIYYLKAKNLSQ